MATCATSETTDAVPRLTHRELLGHSRWRTACFFLGLLVCLFDAYYCGIGVHNQALEDAPSSVIRESLFLDALSSLLGVLEVILLPLVAIPPLRRRMHLGWQFKAGLRFFQLVMASSLVWAASGIYFLGLSLQWWDPVDFGYPK